MCAGQAIVQFVVDIRNRCEYAVKFFLDSEAFLTEAALYAACFPAVRSTVSSDVMAASAAFRGGEAGGSATVDDISAVVARFLPQVEAVCDNVDAGLTDPNDHPLPPCIVMEKGESLHDWSDRAVPDLFTCLAVRSFEPSSEGFTLQKQ